MALLEPSSVKIRLETVHFLKWKSKQHAKLHVQLVFQVIVFGFTFPHKISLYKLQFDLTFLN